MSEVSCPPPPRRAEVVLMVLEVLEAVATALGRGDKAGDGPREQDGKAGEGQVCGEN